MVIKTSCQGKPTGNTALISSQVQSRASLCGLIFILHRSPGELCSTHAHTQLRGNTAPPLSAQCRTHAYYRPGKMHSVQV